MVEPAADLRNNVQVGTTDPAGNDPKQNVWNVLDLQEGARRCLRCGKDGGSHFDLSSRTHIGRTTWSAQTSRRFQTFATGYVTCQRCSFFLPAQVKVRRAKRCSHSCGRLPLKSLRGERIWRLDNCEVNQIGTMHAAGFPDRNGVVAEHLWERPQALRACNHHILLPGWIMPVLRNPDGCHCLLPSPTECSD